MENALLVGLSRQVALRRELDIIANNVANLGTSGFKRDALLFEQHLASSARENDFPAADQRVAFVLERATRTEFAQGPIEQTRGELDVAIEGEGFLVVETPRGERYTRNGSLARNANGEIVTSEGYRVMGESGPLVLDQNDTQISIADDGTLSARNSGVNVEKGKIRIVRFDPTQPPSKEGANLFTASSPPLPAEARTRLMHGAIEKSNVSPIREIGRMIEVTRAYTMLTNLMNRTNELRGNAINKLAEVPA
jgi:flagellar basal-body rod protein FlgF